MLVKCQTRHDDGAVQEVGDSGTGIDADFLPDPSPFVLDDAGDLSEKRVVPSEADVKAGMNFGPPLPDKNAPGLDGLSAERLDSEILRVAVSAVPG